VRGRCSYSAQVRVVRPLRPHTRDGWVAVGFALAAAVEAVVRSRDPAYLAINLTGAPLLLFLVMRRSRPLLTLLIFCTGALVGTALQAVFVPHASSDAFVPILAVLLAIYSVGAHGSWRQVALALPLPLLVVIVIDTTRPHSDSLLSALVFFVVFVLTLPIGAGRLVRHRSQLVAQLQAQAVELGQQRAAYVSAALARERVRLAAELDVELAEGMQRLRAALERHGSSDELVDVVRVEGLARELLAATRDVVVTLTSAESSVSEDEAAPSPLRLSGGRFADLAQPWACLLAASVAAGLLLEVRAAHVYVPRMLASVVVVALAAALALLWARPLLATVVVWAGAILVTHQVTPLPPLTTPIALVFVPPFLVAALEPRRRAAVGLVCCWAGILAVDGLHAFPGNAVVATLCSVAGTGVRARAELVEQLRANNVLLEQGRSRLTARALDDERGRLARELHDALGHSLTVVALQAGAARRIWDTDREKAVDMLATTRAAVVEGLRELQGSLVATRDIRSVHDLIAQARAAGVQVIAQVDDRVVALPEQHLQTIYRTVQEALTNAVKHSPGSVVKIALRWADGGVELRVANGPPVAPASQSHRSGHGLLGMRHRLELLGGSLSHETAPDGGFLLCAQLPGQVRTA